MLDFPAMTARMDAQGLLRTFDARLINGIVNRNPDIAKAILHDPATGNFDASAAVGAFRSIILMDNRADAAAMFEWSSPTIWQAHTVFDHTHRGKLAIQTAKTMIREMFTVWQAEEIWGATPVDNRAAHFFNRKIGAQYVGQDEHHTSGTVLNFRIKRDEWLSRSN